ncbi:MAG TPA: hypothetical protein VF599_23490 [Pyrinomonadaceae bacterium]|jgi:hypothetical protein
MRELKQFSLILGLMLSLVASSLGACVCSHHQEKAKTEAPSCHSQAAEDAADDAEQTNETDSPAETVTGGDACCCVQPAPKVVTKSETVKPEKQTAALPTAATAPATIVFAAQVIPAQNYLPKPLYLTDSFYNLSPGRAPPRL